MRRVLPLLFALLAAVPLSSRAVAQENVVEGIDAPQPDIGSMPLPARRPDARRMHYQLHLKQLDAQIRLAGAEIQSLGRQISEYELISRARGSSPFLVTLEYAKLRQLEVEIALEQLRRHKLLMIHDFQKQFARGYRPLKRNASH